MVELNYDPELEGAEDQRESFGVIPTDWYVGEIVSNDEKPTKSGAMVVLGWKITEGEYAGHHVWDNINYVNASAEAQRIGRSRLKATYQAVGIDLHVRDLDELHGIAARIRVGVEKDRTGQYPDKNKILAVKALDATTEKVPASRPAATPRQHTPPQTRAQTTKAAPPLAKPANGQKGPAWERAATADEEIPF